VSFFADYHLQVSDALGSHHYLDVSCTIGSNSELTNLDARDERDLVIEPSLVWLGTS
jgi:hypothetical protein